MTDPAGERHRRYGVLAAALLALELVAGLQTYLLYTVVPLVAQDLGAHQYYGVITAAAPTAVFVTMPLGPFLLRRFHVDRLLLALTGLSVAGGVVSALAPDVATFVAGRVGSGLATGALATVSLAAIVTVLPATWRRFVLAGYNVMWVAISLAGPLYAGWVASTLGWRWALVLYLPVLVAARGVVARQLRGAVFGGNDERLPLGAALALAAGVAVLSLVGLRTPPIAAVVAAGVLGFALTVVAAGRLLPVGVFRVRRGRPAALATMGLVTGAYFGAQGIAAIVVHDLLGGDPRAVAIVLGAGGLGWAMLGLYAARRPARGRGYARRAAVGATLLALGLAGQVAALAPATPHRIAVTAVGWALAGVGIGAVYLDTLNRVVDEPEHTDGVSVARAAAAVVLVEQIAATATSTVGAAALGRAIEVAEPVPVAAVVLLACAGLAVAAGAAARRA